MLTKYFQRRFEEMPKPSGLSTEEARQLVIDAYRLLLGARLAVADVGVETQGTDGEDLDTLLRLADYLSAYTAVSARVPQAEISASSLSSANFVAAQIFEFLAEYQAVERSGVEYGVGDAASRFTGLEFWTEEGYLWINAIAHYLMARHDGNATTLTRRFRGLSGSTDDADLLSRLAYSDSVRGLSCLVVETLVNFLSCDFQTVLRTADRRRAVSADLPAESDDVELLDLALISALWDIAEACEQMAEALIVLDRHKERSTRPWVETLGRAQNTADLLDDSALKWIIDLIRRVMEDFGERGILFVEFPDPSPESSDWHDYLEHRAQGGRALLWPAHLEAIDRGSLDVQRSLVVSMPTGSGKSLIAEMRIAATLQHEQQAWVLYIVPTNALVRQVKQDLEEALEPLVTTVRGFLTQREYTYLTIESLSPAELPSEPTNYVAVMTPEKLRLGVSLWPEAFDSCALSVVDEAHLIGDFKRGSLLDLALAQLRTVNPEIPFVLLSAMMRNPEDLGQWLSGIGFLDELRPTRQALMLGIPGDEAAAEQVARRRRLGNLHFATVYQSDWEPSPENVKWMVEEKTCVFEQKEDGEPYRFKPTDTARNCTAALVQAGVKTILFLPNLFAESSARKLGARLQLEGVEGGGLDVWERLLQRELGVDSPEVVERLREGVCYHKGPMQTVEQILAEHHFATNPKVQLMVCTSTLSYGMNLPVEALVFAGTKRYDADADEMVEITSADFLNIAGRAGRPAFANQGLIQVLHNWLPADWVPEKQQYENVRKLYLAPADEELAVTSGLCHLLDQISLTGVNETPADELSAIVTAWFGRAGDERLLRNTYAFFLNSSRLDEDPDSYAQRITSSIAEWIRHQEAEFPLSEIALEAFKRSGLPSRTCRHPYSEAGMILEHLAPLRDSVTSGEKGFDYWLDRVIHSVQSPECDFFFKPRVEVGDTAVRGDMEAVWEYEREALHRWISGATRKELEESRFAQGASKYWSTHRASMFMNRTTQQYAFALGSLLFFLECRWRELDPNSRHWDRRSKELELEWVPHLASLPLAIKWGVGTISALAWTVAGVRFRFAAEALGEIYPCVGPDSDIEEQLRRVGKLLRDYRSNHPDHTDGTVSALNTQSKMRGLDYEVEFLEDVANACCCTELL